MAESHSPDQAAGKQLAALAERHLLLGWFGLLLFLSLGIALETMHGFKVGFYLDVQNAARRLMWTLAHAHGTLFSLIHIAFATSLSVMPISSLGVMKFVSKCLTGALVLMPLGFLLGGLWLYGGDPGPGVFLVPIGAILMLGGVAMFCVTLVRSRRAVGTEPSKRPPQTLEKQAGKASRKRRKK